MTARALTPGERTLVADMFGDAVDAARVTIRRRRWWPLQGRRVVMAPDGHVWFHPQSAAWREDFATAPIALKALFVHEMTHVWQAQRNGRWWLLLARHPLCRYSYRLEPGRPFARYGIEQQAEIVADAYLRAQGVDRPGAVLRWSPALLEAGPLA